MVTLPGELSAPPSVTSSYGPPRCLASRGTAVQGDQNPFHPARRRGRVCARADRGCEGLTHKSPETHRCASARALAHAHACTAYPLNPLMKVSASRVPARSQHAAQRSCSHERLVLPCHRLWHALLDRCSHLVATMMEGWWGQPTILPPLCRGRFTIILIGLATSGEPAPAAPSHRIACACLLYALAMC